jgi:hypothetical protein
MAILLLHPHIQTSVAVSAQLDPALMHHSHPRHLLREALKFN